MRAYNIFVALVLFGFITQTVAQDPYIFLTNEDGFSQLSGSTFNQFDSANSVWLNAGPILCNTVNPIVAGTYYFQVLDSTGKLLSSDAVTARTFKVSSGGITSFAGTGHLTGQGPCGYTSIQLQPFATATGTYTVQVSASSTFKTPVYSTTFTIATPAAQAGWKASYYSSVQQNVDISPQSRYNSPAIQMVTTSLDFSSNWAIGTTGIKLDGLYFAATFAAVLTAPSTATYTFTATGREGVRLWIDGQKVIDNWKSTSSILTSTGKISLTSGSKYQFVVEYFNGVGTPSFNLKWAIGTASAVAVPSSAFSAASFPIGVASSTTVFATIDNTHPLSATLGTTSNPSSLPSGFSLATITTGTAALLSYRWGCDCLVTATGACIPHTTSTVCGTATVKKTTVGSTDYYSVTPPTGSKLTYRLLISAPTAAAPAEYVTPSNTITYNGIEYALLDGSPSNAGGTGDCAGSQQFWKVPPGWALAASNKDIASVVISFGWSGAVGVVVGGNILSTDTGGLLATGGLDVDSTGSFYRAKAKSYCTRVLISRSTTNANSWDAVPITNYLSCPDLVCEYATIDNADPLGSGTQFSCPPLAFKLPPGWSLAKRSSVFEQFITDRSITFGALCLTYDDGTGYLTIADDSVTDRVTPCGNAQLRGVTTLSSTIVNTKKRQKLDGALWTSTIDGAKVDANIYPAKTAVYLIGGPTNCAGNGLPNGDYYFQITDPPGKLLLSTDTIEDRRVTVVNGRIASTTGTHNTNPGVCGLMVQATPYLDSPNGEYKAWITPVGAYDASKGSYSFGFGTATSKTDNFRVKLWNTTSVPTTGTYGVRDCSITRRILIQRCPGDNPTTTAPPATVDTTPCGTCTAWGDPHVTTFWGAKYNFFGLGSFTYAEPTGTTKNWRIWGYLSKVQTASCNTEIHFQYNTDNCSFTVPATTKQVTGVTFLRGGVVTDPSKESGKLIAVKKIKASQYTLTMPNGITATITLDYWYINMITLTFTVPNSLKGLTQGLCGTCGDKYFRLGTSTTTSISGKENTFGAQWVVPNTPLVSFTPSYTPSCPDATLNAKAQALCKVHTDTFDYNNCIIDFCNTGSTAVVTGATKYNGPTNSICVKTTTKTTTTFCPVSDEALSNVTTFAGRDYATLDFISPSDRSAGSQLGFLSPPDHWKIAEDYPVRHALATCTRFGTNCLIFAEGTSISHSLQKCGSPSQTNIQSAQDDCWKPLTTGRIVVTTNDNVDWNTPTDTGAVKHTTVADSPVGATETALDFVTPNGEKAEATITGPYNSDNSFAVYVYGKTKTAPKKSAAGAFYGFQIDLKYADGTTASNVASGTFDFADTTWANRWVDIYPTKVIANVTLRLLLTGHTGAEVYFYGWQYQEASKWGAGNLLKDPTVQISDTTQSPWQQYKGGWTYSSQDNTFGDASGSIQLQSKSSETYDKAGDYGAIQVVKMSDWPQYSSTMTGLYFRADAKVLSTQVNGNYGAGFSIYVDVFYTDGINASYGINAQFQRNATGWQTAEKYALIRNVPVSYIQVVALFRLSAGTAVFDNIYLTPLYCNFPYPPSDSPSTSYGDPHLVTLDGIPYDVQLLGDFILLQDQSLTIMVRHSRALFAAVNSMTSFVYNDTVFTFERNKDTTPPLLTVNGKAVILNPGGTIELPNGIGSITSAGSLSPPLRTIRYDIDLPTTGHKVTLTANVGDYKVQWLQVYPLLPSSSLNNTRGLLGVYNFDKSDDFTNSMGRVLPQNSDVLTLMREFAWTWKLSSSPLQNQLTPDNDLENEAIPDKVLTIQDFPSDQQLAAEQACAGIALYESCVLDILLSGDAGYAHGYNSLESILTSSDFSKPAQQSLNNDDSSDRYRQTVLIVVFSVLGGLLIAGIVVALIMWNNSQKRRGGIRGSSTMDKGLVGN